MVAAEVSAPRMEVVSDLQAAVAVGQEFLAAVRVCVSLVAAEALLAAIPPQLLWVTTLAAEREVQAQEAQGKMVDPQILVAMIMDLVVAAEHRHLVVLEVRRAGLLLALLIMGRRAIQMVSVRAEKAGDRHITTPAALMVAAMEAI